MASVICTKAEFWSGSLVSGHGTFSVDAILYSRLLWCLGFDRTMLWRERLQGDPPGDMFTC